MFKIPAKKKKAKVVRKRKTVAKTVRKEVPKKVIQQAKPVRRSNSFAMIALILGVIGIVFFWVPILDMVASLLAIFFGARGLAVATKYKLGGKAYAITGLVLGIIGTLLWVYLIIKFYPMV